MCGRYTLSGNLAEIRACFKAEESLTEDWNWSPKYNISPGMVVPAVAFDGEKRRKVVPMRWGLHPHWRKEAPEGRPLFNARVETAAEKASFRTPFRRRRALIPTSGWYEWDGVETPKTPNFITEDHDDMFAFAGLWDKWRVDEGIELLSCTILTTAATGRVKHLHHRMPVRLPMEKWDDWLDPESDPDRVLGDMRGGEDLVFWEVDRAVNSGRAEGAELVKKANAA
jgi:putative SOS response-associated peptidase YedK